MVKLWPLNITAVDCRKVMQVMKYNC
jgi:hypothetical protein